MVWPKGVQQLYIIKYLHIVYHSIIVIKKYCECTYILFFIIYVNGLFKFTFSTGVYT
jgi:hypothetical protein